MGRPGPPGGVLAPRWAGPVKTGGAVYAAVLPRVWAPLVSTFRCAPGWFACSSRAVCGARRAGSCPHIAGQAACTGLPGWCLRARRTGTMTLSCGPDYVGLFRLFIRSVALFGGCIKGRALDACQLLISFLVSLRGLWQPVIVFVGRRRRGFGGSSCSKVCILIGFRCAGSFLHAHHSFLPL